MTQTKNSAFKNPGANPKVRATNPNTGRSSSPDCPMGKRGKSGVTRMFRRKNIPMTPENIDKYYLHLGYAEKKEEWRTAHNEERKAERCMELEEMLQKISAFQR